MGKINIRRTLILLGVFILGGVSYHLVTISSVGKVLGNDTINNAVNQPTTSVTTNNKVELKKNKGSLVFEPSTQQNLSQCDSVLKAFIDSISVKQFRRIKKAS